MYSPIRLIPLLCAASGLMAQTGKELWTEPFPA